MHALIVVSHPLPTSLTHAVAAAVGEGIASAPGGHGHELADLAAEKFDPSFNAHDVSAFFRETGLPEDVAAEQARIDRADALVLVYPVYWWSMPGLMKGWIDRVFSNGWAYEEGPDMKIEKKLGRLAVHLVALGGADHRTYARHGYFGAMKVQIDHGIFDYCGATVKTSELMVPTDGAHAEAHLETARKIGSRIFSRENAG